VKTETECVRILLVEDQALVRQSLQVLLEKQAGMTVAGVAENGREAIELARELRPDVVVMDVALPGLNGIEATRQIRCDVPDTKVVALSAYPDHRRVARMLQAGASAYILKLDLFEELTRAVSAAVRGETHLSPSLVRPVVGEYLSRQAPKTEGLTAREREVLQLFSEGESTKQIAAALNVSVPTVATHRRQLMAKLGVQSIAELTKYAVREGITFVDC